MIIFKDANDLRNYLAQQKGGQLGFVPTMGALHPGHISLAEICKKANDIAVASIFINPTQFNDKKDFDKYPVTIENDIRLLQQAGCDILFLPTVEEMYPQGIPARHYDLGKVETTLEGSSRPGHFQGVAMIVHRLLDIVQPHNLYIGQKDYQQCLVIKELVRLTGMDSRVQVNVCPTLREADGLAMSSRNTRLDANERIRAAGIYQALLYIQKNLVPGNLSGLQNTASEMLTRQGFRVDYVSVADAETLEPVAEWNGSRPLVALVAAFNGEVRLIDNMVLS